MENSQTIYDKVIRIILTIFSLVLLIANWLKDYPEEYIKITAWAVIIISAYLMVRCINNWELFILFFFLLYYNYSIMIAEYLFPVDNLFTSYAGDKESFVCENIVLAYMTILCAFAPKEIQRKNKVNRYYIEDKNNNIIVYVLSIALIFILIFGYVRPDKGERGSPSTYFEYAIILFIVGYSFSNVYTKKILTVLLILFALQNFIYGGRVTGVQLIIVWFLMNYAYKANFIKIAPVAVALMLILNFIGSTRGNYSNTQGIMTNVINTLQEEKFANNTSYSAYHTSITFIKAETVGWSERLRIFGNFILSMFLGGSSVKDSNLAEYTHRFYAHYYGGVLPIYLHFFMGKIGVCVSGVVTALYVRMIANIKESSKTLLKCISVYIVTGISRWYLYSPSNLFRGCMILCVVYFAFDMLNSKMKPSV